MINENFIYTHIEEIDEAVEYLKCRGVGTPDVGVVLGSGLNSYTDYILKLERDPDSFSPIVVDYGDIPGFYSTKVNGHDGKLIYAEDNGVKVAILAGRYHYYEGYYMTDVVFPVRTLIRLGIKRLVLTNASGAINENFRAGSLMLISDHINLTGHNPLRGPNLEELGPRFPDMTDAYTSDLRRQVKEQAEKEGIHLEEGVYVGLIGPSFETPAEIRFFRTIGGDAVGMSSVPEAIAASHAGIELIGISLLSNMAAGITGNKMSIEEVNESGENIEADFHKVLNIAISVGR